MLFREHYNKCSCNLENDHVGAFAKLNSFPLPQFDEEHMIREQNDDMTRGCLRLVHRGTALLRLVKRRFTVEYII